MSNRVLLSVMTWLIIGPIGAITGGLILGEALAEGYLANWPMKHMVYTYATVLMFIVLYAGPLFLFERMVTGKWIWQE